LLAAGINVCWLSSHLEEGTQDLLRDWLEQNLSGPPEGFKRCCDGVELIGYDSGQALERCGSFLELSGGEHDLIVLDQT
jgi:hypothetical protein